MMPVFALPPLPIQLAPQTASLPVQAVDFEALLSVSTTPVSEPTSAPPPIQDNVTAIVAAPEVYIDAEIIPLLAAFGTDAVPHSVSGEVSVSERDSIDPVQRESAEIAIVIPAGASVQVAEPIIVAAVIVPPMLPSAFQKGAPPVMDRDVEPNAGTDPAPVSTITIRPPIPAALTSSAPTRAIPGDAVAIADLAGLFVSTSIENNAPPAASIQALVTDRIAQPAVRPITDASAIVADRALDVAQGSLWLDQLAADIGAVQDEGRDLSFRLIPPQLGQLDVKIATSDDGMQLNFSTQTEEAAQIIGSAQSRLVEELKAQGVRVAGSEVNAGSGQSAFAQHNGQPTRPQIIAEFDRPSNDFSEQTLPNELQNGRFA